MAVSIWVRIVEIRNELTFDHAVTQVRRVIGDFGVTIAILIMVLVDYMIPHVYIQVLPSYRTHHSTIL